MWNAISSNGLYSIYFSQSKSTLPWVSEWQKKNMPPAFSPEHICPMNLVYSNTTEDNIQDFHIVLQSQLLVLQLRLQFETQYIKSL